MLTGIARTVGLGLGQVIGFDGRRRGWMRTHEICEDVQTDCYSSDLASVVDGAGYCFDISEIVRPCQGLGTTPATYKLSDRHGDKQ